MKEKPVKKPFKQRFAEFKLRFKEWLDERKRQLKKNSNIIRELVKKNVKIQYRNSAIGAIWTVLNPLLNMLVMFIVFSKLFGRDDPTYALYLLCGNVMFNTMRGATTQSLPCLVHNRGLLTKNRISYSVFPISSNLSALVNFAFSLIALLGVMVVVHFQTFNNEMVDSIFSWNLLYILLMVPALFLFNYGISLFLSALYVFFRDVQHFYTVFLTLWTYLTPIFYKKDMLDDNVLIQGIIKLNPMYHFVTFFRDIVYNVSAYGYTMGGGIWESLGVLYLIGILFLVLGGFVFVLTKRKFIFYI